MLKVDLGTNLPGAGGVAVSQLSAGQSAALKRRVRAAELLDVVLTVSVIQPGVTDDEALPSVAGTFTELHDGLLFTPHFPFVPGLEYRATFRPGLLGDAEGAEPSVLQFSLPCPPAEPPAVVMHVYPKADRLPENLLRLYVVFSRPMQRGLASSQIELLGPDGQPAPDVLYRAPVELWDRSMRTLTVLLDPGRLKRGVGPHRELGPPLASGRQYTLRVGAGMLDQRGRPLTTPVEKRFHVTAPIRGAIAVHRWQMLTPTAHSSQPLVLVFPAPLDWALSLSSLSVKTASGEPVTGRISVEDKETRWSFAPAQPWSPGSYRLHLHADLEDVCGNDLLAAFDRQLRPDSEQRCEQRVRHLDFSLT